MGYLFGNNSLLYLLHECRHKNERGLNGSLDFEQNTCNKHHCFCLAIKALIQEVRGY